MPVFKGLYKSKKIRLNEKSKKLEDPVYEFRFTKIAIKYLKTDLIINLIACVPLLIYEMQDPFEYSIESTFHCINDPVYWYINLFSLLRFYMIWKMFSTVLLLASKAEEHFFTKRVLIYNVKNIALRCVQGLLMIHTASCI